MLRHFFVWVRGFGFGDFSLRGGLFVSDFDFFRFSTAAGLHNSVFTKAFPRQRFHDSVFTRAPSEQLPHKSVLTTASSQQRPHNSVLTSAPSQEHQHLQMNRAREKSFPVRGRVLRAMGCMITSVIDRAASKHDDTTKIKVFKYPFECGRDAGPQGRHPVLGSRWEWMVVAGGCGPSIQRTQLVHLNRTA